MLEKMYEIGMFFTDALFYLPIMTIKTLKIKSLSKKSLRVKALSLYKKRTTLNSRMTYQSMKSLKIKVKKTVMKSSNPTMMPMTMSLK